MSTLPLEQLPGRATDVGCKHVVNVNYKLTSNDMELRIAQRWKLKKKYWRADFFFVVMLGPADLRFEIRGKNGVLSSGHDRLHVDFLDPTEPLSATIASPKSFTVQQVSEVPARAGSGAVRYA